MQWSPHASRPSWVVSTSNQKAMLWNLALPSNKAIEHVIHGHTRAITDINFHSSNPEILATSSIDSYIHCWDMRTPRKPFQSFAEFFSGANQVKWNRHNQHILASSHDSRVFIWDDRKNSIPVATIKAHPLKVNGLDFSRTEPYKLMTCSNDRTVKIWDFEKNMNEPVYTIETDFPVGRARFTPFGAGALIMPSRGGHNSLSLVDIKDKTGVQCLNRVHEFTAHNEPVREFVWRTRGGNSGDLEDREFQLVTWSKDNDVRLWPLSEDTLNKVHYAKGQPINMPLTRRGALYKTFHGEPADDRSPSKTAAKPSRSSYGSSPGTLRTPHFSSGGLARPKVGTVAFMTRAGNKAAPDSVNYHRNSQLQWISGVRMGRSAFTAFDQTASADIQTSMDETPGNLGEEISLVGLKFPRVRFEKISVPKGEVTILLNSPNGFENVLIFLRVDIKFPQEYPLRSPTFCVEENYMLTSENRQEIEVELSVLAENLSNHGVYCLEPCLRILLGEKVSVQDYYEEEKYIDDIGIRGDNLDSSQEDLMNSGNYGAYTSSSDDEGIVDHPNPLIPPSVDSTPVPKGCGAYWSKGGFLVCFFMQKKEKPKASSNILFNDRSFGGPNPKYSSSHLLNDSNGVSDDESYTSGSDETTGTSPLHWMFPGRLRSNIRMRHIAHRPLSAADRSQGTHQPGGIASEPKNMIRILDFRHLIPARRELAAEYEILGSYPKELCRHNSAVAEKYGCYEVADCWRLIEMILTTQLPPTDSADLLANSTMDEQGIARFLAKGAFQWGSHPFGRRWLVEQLFDYFEKQQNPQMLANMSCIFASVSTAPNPLTISLPMMDSIFTKNLSSPYADFARKGGLTPSSSALQTPYFSGKFNPWDFSIPSPGSLSNRHDIEAMAAVVASGNLTYASAHGTSQNKQTTSSLMAGASPTSSKNSSVVSSSPEKFSSARRAVAGIFSRTGSQLHTHLAPSVPVINSQTHKRNSSHTSMIGMGYNNYWNNNYGSSPLASASNSPQLHSHNSFLSNSTAPINRGDSENDLHFQMMFNTNPATRLASRSSITGLNGSNYSECNNENPLLPKLRFTILDEDLLDHGESLPPISLLDPAKDEKYKLYRMQYAGILFSWGLEIESLEVLKFNYTKGSFGSRTAVLNVTPSMPSTLGSLEGRNDGEGSQVLKGLKKATRNEPASDFAFLHSANIQFHIHSQDYDSETINTPQEYDSETINTGTPRSTYYKSCQYCGLSVRKRFFFCLHCEHILHATCAQEWWVKCGAEECASGCGCRCLDMI